MPDKARSGNGVAQSGIVTPATPTVVGDFNVLGKSIVNALNGIVVEAAIGSEEFKGHDADVPSDANMFAAPVGSRADRSGHVRTVTVVVHGIAIVEHGVDAKNVVDEAVGVVIGIVAGDFARVAPHLRGEINVVVVDAGINDGNDDVGAAGGEVPGGHNINVSATNAAVLAVV